MSVLRFKSISPTSIAADSEYGRYVITEVGNRRFEVRRNNRLIHTAGYADDATRMAGIDMQDRARKVERRLARNA
jgi:hypothetical protein